MPLSIKMFENEIHSIGNDAIEYLDFGNDVNGQDGVTPTRIVVHASPPIEYKQMNNAARCV